VTDHSQSADQGAATHPVRVIEQIPVPGPHGVSQSQILAEGIPTPEHLRVLPELARGGMGRIHPATDRNLLRHVALKRLAAELALEPFYRDGFVAEAQITGQLEHPNIVPVHELAVDPSGVPYFTMKLIHGGSFHEWLHEPGHELGSTARLEGGLEIFLKVCDAVAYAHHRGVIHRDLKPANIMVADFGQVYLMDWGLARLTKTPTREDAMMNAPGPVGTAEYMSPEQALGNPQQMDERSDVFGLGAVLCEIVTGQHPYGFHHDQDVLLERAQRGEVRHIDELAAGLDVPKRIRAIITRATAPQPARRYQRVVDLQKDVRSFLLGGFHLPTKHFTPGEIIIREGDRGESAYMIVGGKCRAYRTVGTEQETLAMMGAGEVFGEMALLLDDPRAASVEAVDYVTALVLDQATMSEGLGLDGWTGSLVRALAQRFRNLEQQVRGSGLRRG
jgi:eukaryotic-like serine/threonine-protein kinase